MTTFDAGLFARSGSEPATFGQVLSGRANLVPDDPGSEEHLSMDIDCEVSSFLPVTPTIRRLFAREVDTATTSYGTLKRVDQDGSFPCPQRDCYNVLPTREAYTCHIHIHLIHEGYVFRVDRAICAGVLTMPRCNRLRLCELCGMRFIDDDHKDGHLNSCPKLPIFHEIESFNNGSPGQWTLLRFS